jgi:hypothetical protein
MDNETDSIVVTYLDLMDQQRAQLFADLEGLSEAEIWQVSGENEGSIGDNLDHLRVINSSTLTMFKITWLFLLPLVKVRYDQPYPESQHPDSLRRSFQ